MSRQAAWKETVSNAKDKVVQIRSTCVRSFDSNEPAPTMGTAFIVDKEFGLLLTNRHVAMTGPVRAEAHFHSDEEVIVKAVYVDPVHDFAFMRFDVNKLKHTKVKEFVLNPAGARPGVEVRVLGSDAGEKFMVLSGTISRTDRNVPEYEVGSGFSDQNTYYITAACDTSGGSSGSPIINLAGEVVALNAGAAMDAASSFFLAIDFVSVILAKVRQCLKEQLLPMRDHIPRGTFQCVFYSTTMAECKRLGVTAEDEAMMRSHTANKGHTLLVVDALIPEGPAKQAGIKHGDVLLRLDGSPVNAFLDLELLLDSKVSRKEDILVQLRRGKKLIDLNVQPSSAYQFVPDEFIEFSNGIIHEIGFSHARDFSLPLRSVIVASQIRCFEFSEIGAGSVLLEMDGKRIKSIRDVEAVLKTKGDKDKMSVRVCGLGSGMMQDLHVAECDRKWFDVALVSRDPNDYSRWIKHPIPFPSPSPRPIVPSTGEKKRRARSTNPADAFVLVRFRMPFSVDAYEHLDYLGTGQIFDVDEGLVIIDRNTIVSALGEPTIEFAGTHRVPATVVFLHPTQNVAVLRFDVDLLPLDFPLNQLTFANDDFSRNGNDIPSQNLRKRDVKAGDVLTYMGLSRQAGKREMPDQRVVAVERGSVQTGQRARFASKNFDVVKFDRTDVSTLDTLGGVYVDTSGVVRALATSVHIADADEEVWLATRSGPVARTIELVRRRATYVPSLAAEFNLVPLHRAKTGFGLSEEWLRRIAQVANDEGYSRECFKIQLLMAGTPPCKTLLSGDLLLAVNGEIRCAFSYAWIEHELEQHSPEGFVRVTLVRDGKLLENVQVEVAMLSAVGTRRTMRWAGLWLQPTMEAARWHGFVPSFVSDGKGTGVYVASIERGSPADEVGFPESCWITEIDGHQIYDIEDVMKVSERLRARFVSDSKNSVRIRCLSWQGAEGLLTLDLDEEFFPVVDISFDEGVNDWKRVEIGGPP